MLCNIQSCRNLWRYMALSSVLTLGTYGCSTPEQVPPEAESTKPADDSTGAPLAQLALNEPTEPIAADSDPTILTDRRIKATQRATDSPLLQTPSRETSAFHANQPDSETHQGVRQGTAATEIEQPETRRQLRDGMTPSELVQFLAMTDEDMEWIHSNRAEIVDPRDARRTLLQIIDMKLQASRQLAGHPSATEAQRSSGKRGELQALSHKSSLSDVKAAEELEELAKANMDSGDPRLVADSRLVLIGFAIESLQNGDERAAENIVQYTDQIASSDSAADVPALIVMGQAKQMLDSYGHKQLAKTVRNSIVAKFGDSKNPDVASMAAQFAGNVLLDDVDKIREQILKGESISIDQWIQSVETLIDESADIQTVSYLAGAAVDFEANGLLPFADATLKTLQARFNQPQAATTREVQTAIDAMVARQQIIGKTFDPDLPSTDGASLRLADYRGKVVLVPFWAIGIPTSLQAIPILQSVRDANPETVAIVGVNLDPHDAPVQEFLQTNKILFPSYSLAADQASTIPKDFGVVSMPFVVILDKQGKVAAIQLSDKNLTETVLRLVSGT